MDDFAAHSTAVYALLPNNIAFSDMSASAPASDISTQPASPISSARTSPSSTPSTSAKLSPAAPAACEPPADARTPVAPRPERTLTGWACFLPRRQPSAGSGISDDSSFESLAPSSRLLQFARPARATEAASSAALKLGGPSHKRRSESRLSKMARQTSAIHRSFAFSSLSAGGRRVADTQAEFRRLLLKRRVVTVDTGHKFRLCPMPMNGDCGFHAIARAINHERELARVDAEPATASGRFWKRFARPSVPTDYLQSRHIREALLRELKKSRAKLLSDMQQDMGEVITDEHFNALEREVSRPGISGHWLGTQLGVLEHVLISRDIGVNINIYQFDVSQQKVRKVENADVERPQHVVNLLFSGPALTGHFDALLPVDDK